MQFGIIVLWTENLPAIQEQDGLFVFPDGFYHVCAPGQTTQTARTAATAANERINGSLYNTGVKDRDAPVTLGKRGNRGKKAEQERKKQWKNNPFYLNLL
jgi:hypothetical protein